MKPLEEWQAKEFLEQVRRIENSLSMKLIKLFACLIYLSIFSAWLISLIMLTL